MRRYAWAPLALVLAGSAAAQTLAPAGQPAPSAPVLHPGPTATTGPTAAGAPGSPAKPGIVLTPQLCAQLRAQAMNGADYVPGIDAYGRPVAPADLPQSGTTSIGTTTTNILIDVVDENHAKGRAYYTFYYDGEGRDPALLTGPMAVGQYRDEFIRTAEGWKFSHREPKNVFMRADFGGVIVRKSDER